MGVPAVHVAENRADHGHGDEEYDFDNHNRHEVDVRVGHALAELLLGLLGGLLHRVVQIVPGFIDPVETVLQFGGGHLRALVPQPFGVSREYGHADHGQQRGTDDGRVEVLRDDAVVQRLLGNDEGELSHGGHPYGRHESDLAFLGSKPEPEEYRDDQESGEQQVENEDRPYVRPKGGEVDLHPHGYEEHGHEQVLHRLHGRVYALAVPGRRHEQTHDEGPDGHGQSCDGCQPCHEERKADGEHYEDLRGHVVCYLVDQRGYVPQPNGDAGDHENSDGGDQHHEAGDLHGRPGKDRGQDGQHYDLSYVLHYDDQHYRVDVLLAERLLGRHDAHDRRSAASGKHGSQDYRLNRIESHDVPGDRSEQHRQGQLGYDYQDGERALFAYFLQVDFQPDAEHQQDQSEIRQDLDRGHSGFVDCECVRYDYSRGEITDKRGQLGLVEDDGAYSR